MSKPDTLVCADTPGIAGSTPDQCSLCQAPIRIAPSGRGILRANPGMRILCIRCATLQMQEDSSIELIPPNNDQLQELLEVIPQIFQTSYMCGRCYEEVLQIFPANCAEKPETLLGQPIGQYHCPGCGAMVLAGIPHPYICRRCLDRAHPGIDR